METLKSTVLIVEDNPGDVGLVVEAFKQSGEGNFELEHAFTFEGGMKLMVHGKVDAVLLDLSLPLFYGLDPLSRMHRSRPRIPIFILSGYNDPELAAESIRVGAQGYIFKENLDGPALVGRVREAIEHRRKFKGRRTTVTGPTVVDESGVDPSL